MWLKTNQKWLISLKKALKKTVIIVDHAYDGFIGEKLAIRNDYDLMILDVIFPSINGFELCKRIREKKPSVPILNAYSTGNNRR